MKMSNFLKIIDIYGEPLRLTLKNKTTIKTTLGGVITILTLLITSIFTWLIGKDLVEKHKADVLRSNKSVRKFLFCLFKQNHFSFNSLVF